MMRFDFKAPCPYCGHVNDIRLDIFTMTDTSVQTCDQIEGGCDRDYVIKTRISIDFKTKKIEGEDDVVAISTLCEEDISMI